MIAQEQHDFLQRVFLNIFDVKGGISGNFFLSVNFASYVWMFSDAGNFSGDLFRRQHKINIACGNRAAWHTFVLGRVVLSKGNSVLSLDSLQSQRAIRGRTGQDHADGLMSLILGERFEERVD